MQILTWTACEQTLREFMTKSGVTALIIAGSKLCVQMKWCTNISETFYATEGYRRVNWMYFSVLMDFVRTKAYKFPVYQIFHCVLFYEIFKEKKLTWSGIVIHNWKIFVWTLLLWWSLFSYAHQASKQLSLYLRVNTCFILWRNEVNQISVAWAHSNCGTLPI